MVTFATFLVFMLTFIGITMIDAYLYKVSFMKAMRFMFDADIMLGKYIVILASGFGFLAGMIVDYRVVKKKGNKY